MRKSFRNSNHLQTDDPLGILRKAHSLWSEFTTCTVILHASVTRDSKTVGVTQMSVQTIVFVELNELEAEVQTLIEQRIPGFEVD
jgi:hypothetical protein